MKLLTSFAILSIIVSGSALAKECRIPDPIPGAKTQLPPGCRDTVQPDLIEASKKGYVKRNQGFIDLGNGTQVRIGGRVRAEVGIGR